MASADVNRVLKTLPWEATVAEQGGGDWDGGDGQPYLLLHAVGTHRALMETANDRFFVADGRLTHEIWAISDDGTMKWLETREVSSPRYHEIYHLTREAAQNAARAYLHNARSAGEDPFGLLVKPAIWEFELRRNGKDAYLWSVRARPRGRSSWHVSGLNVLRPRALREIFGGLNIDPAADDALAQLVAIQEHLSSQGAEWSSPTSGTIQLQDPQDVKLAAKRFIEQHSKKKDFFLDTPALDDAAADALMYVRP